MITSKIYRSLSNKKAGISQLLQKYYSSQYQSRGEIEVLQWKKLISLLMYSFENIPYYKKVFNECGLHPKLIKKPSDLKKIPILTKDIIRANFDDLISVKADRNSLIKNSTGGSSGTPLQLYQDQNFRIHTNAARIRGWQFVKGYNLGDTYALLWGADRDIKSNYSLGERLSVYFKYGEIPMNAFNLSKERKLEFIRWCNVLRPQILRAYVTAVKDLAKFLEETGCSFPPLKGVVFGAETVDAHTKKYIEKIFNTKGYISYGCRELGLLAMECSEGCLHQIAENHYFEFVPLKKDISNEMSELIITNLHNYAMPFIRYQIGDIGVKGKDTPCKCGRGLPTIERIIGRTTEVFYFSDGSAIPGEMFIHIMKDFPVARYQFAQTASDRVVLRIQKNKDINHELKQKILRKYKEYLPEVVSMEIVEKDTIEKTITGKFRFVKVEMGKPSES